MGEVLIPRTDRYWRDRVLYSLMHLCDAEHFGEFQRAVKIRADLRYCYGLAPEELIAGIAVTMELWKPPVRMEAAMPQGRYIPCQVEGHDVVKR